MSVETEIDIEDQSLYVTTPERELTDSGVAHIAYGILRKLNEDGDPTIVVLAVRMGVNRLLHDNSPGIIGIGIDHPDNLEIHPPELRRYAIELMRVMEQRAEEDPSYPKCDSVIYYTRATTSTVFEKDGKISSELENLHFQVLDDIDLSVDELLKALNEIFVALTQVTPGEFPEHWITDEDLDAAAQAQE